VEDDIDITNVNEVVWAFATRAHPEHGELHFPAEPTQVAGEVYLDEAELHSYQAGKVVYNCLLADRFAKGDRPVKGSLQNGWPREIQLRVLDRWTTQYGYGAQGGQNDAPGSACGGDADRSVMRSG
jgi:3-polyprenyl-4-hydroxybenzoate decarboxylase